MSGFDAPGAELDINAACTRIERILDTMPFGGSAYHGIGGHLSDIRRMGPLERLKLIERKLDLLRHYLVPVGERLNAVESEQLRRSNFLAEMRDVVAELKALDKEDHESPTHP